jgi:hypothetical protein
VNARSSYEVRAYRPGDEEPLLALHNRSFAGHAPRTMAHWRWKFRENPVGTTEIVLGTDDSGRAVAVYAVVAHRILLEGRECRAGLQTDMAIDPELRTGLGGSRLIVAVGEEFQARFLGDDVRLEWGFPEPQLQRVCLRHLKVGVLRDVVFLARDCGAPMPAPTGLSVHAGALLPIDVDALWQVCAGEIGTGTIRDARYLEWRYLRHPDVAHLALSARDAQGTLRGLAVLREGGFDARVLSLMDWLVPLGDIDAERALLAHAHEECLRRGKEALLAWFPTPWPLFRRFQRAHGFFAASSPFQECYRSREAGLGRRWLDEHWYQTMGDIDFF